ncbi:probable endo-1,3(4)-beta-glucanase AFLA_105200 [Gadus morhua]|uniref:probable endo-1,3(4)-beta-glucanase AFLA_105200 n=1 Tax=Gadus morhua TaxID=8049 RepID=UPI0011B65339|nr:probable endo-1,3(4)-beta-glucanase AFLA_105200 [Gadus morhua]
MLSANAGWFLSPLRILLPLLAVPFLLTPEADLTISTAIIPNTKEPFMQNGRPTIGTTGLPTMVTVPSEEPTTSLGVQRIQAQGPESPSTTPWQAILQRSENHTEATTPAGTSLDTTSHVPEAEASPTASYHTEALVRSTSARLESTEAAAVVSEATTAYATPILATTDTSPGLAAATTSGSQTLRSSEAFATSRSSAATPDTPTPTRPPAATVGGRRFFSVLTTPSPGSPPSSQTPAAFGPLGRPSSP